MFNEENERYIYITDSSGDVSRSSPFFYFCGPEIDLSESSAGPKSEKR